MALRGQLQERLWPLLSGQCRQERSSDKRTTQKHLDLSCPVLKSNNNISKKRSYSWAFCVFTFTEHWQLITFHFLTGLVAADCSGPSPSFHTPYRDSVIGLSGQRDWSVGTVWLVYRDSVTGLSGQRGWSAGTQCDWSIGNTSYTWSPFETLWELHPCSLCVWGLCADVQDQGSVHVPLHFFLTTVQVISSERLSVLLLPHMSSALTASRQ